MASKSAKKRAMAYDQIGISESKEKTMVHDVGASSNTPKHKFPIETEIAWWGEVEEKLEVLLYDNSFWGVIKQKYPEATFQWADDEIHRNRITIVIPNVSHAEFYRFAVLERFAMECLQFQMLIRIDKSFCNFIKTILMEIKKGR